MIVDSLDVWRRYAVLHRRFERALTFLVQNDLAGLAPGRHPIDGDRLYVSIDHVAGRGRSGARLEAHRRYIDIQMTIDGDEQIGWTPLAHCRDGDGAFDEGRDVGFFRDTPQLWLPMPPGRFAIFFPDDAHAPLGGEGTVKKAIAKVQIQE
jgi:biofilm protein TabA